MANDDLNHLPVSSDLEEISRLIPDVHGGKLVELGCGRAETTRLLAARFPNLEFVAMEVDQIQHARNLAANELPNLVFDYGGAERIDLPDSSVNFVIMSRSFHHVPVHLMPQSLIEIRRILVPGGLACFLEPVYAGPYNDILRLFHDERRVRLAAIEAIGQSVESASFRLAKRMFYCVEKRFRGFEEFDQWIAGVTHTDFQIDQPLHHRIRAAFEPFVDSAGIAVFRTPMRIDLLRRPEYE